MYFQAPLDTYGFNAWPTSPCIFQHKGRQLDPSTPGDPEKIERQAHNPQVATGIQPSSRTSKAPPYSEETGSW